MRTATNQAVAWGVSEGITKGFSDGGFHPDDPVTRKDTLILLWRAVGSPEPGPYGDEIPFEDYRELMKEGYSYESATYKALIWAINNGITNGQTPNHFGVDDPCLREQIVTFIYRAAN